MSEKELPTFMVQRDPDEFTETIDLTGLLIENLTATGSYDLRRLRGSSLNKLLHALPIPALLVDRSHYVIFANEAWGKIISKRQKIEGRIFSFLTKGEYHAAEAQSLVERIFTERKPKIKEVMLNIGSKQIWGRMHLRPLRMSHERFILILIQDLSSERKRLDLSKQHSEKLRKARDELEKRVEKRTEDLKNMNEQLRQEITERSRTENALRESEERYRQFFNVSPAPTIIHRHNVILLANDAAVRLHRASTPQDLVGRSMLDLIHPNFREHVRERIRQAQEESVTSPFTSVDLLGVDGTIVYAETASVPTIYMGEPAVQCVGRDVTQRRLAELALLASEEHYRLLTENSLTGIYIHQNGRFVYVNRRLATMMGYSPEEMIGRNFVEFVHPEDRAWTVEQAKSPSSSEGSVPQHAFRALCRNGETKWFEVLATSTTYRGHPANMGNVADITDRLGAQKALSLEKQRFETLAEQAPFGLVMISKEGLFQYVNERFKQMFGYDSNDIPDEEEWLKNAFPDFANREKAMNAWKKVETLSTGIQYSEILPVRIKDESERIIDFRPVRLDTGECLLTCEDITDRKRFEEQLQQSQKMEAIGSLAGGVAHDFNNLLTAIIGYSNLLLQKMPAESPYHYKIIQIYVAAERAAGLTKQLLAFSRKQVLDVKILDLNSVIEEMSNMLRRMIGEHIEFTTVMNPSLGKVKADKSQVEQILMNLAINARDAMPTGGALTIETDNVVLDEEYARVHQEIQAGPYVMIAVSDVGHGISKDIMPRIFEPFFTTKQKGQGTGLGLSTAYGIIKQHQGHITAYSEPDRGTTFKVYLPLSREIEDRVFTPHPTSQQLTGKETVLVVEDEATVRHLTCEMLENLGYTVMRASDPVQAIDICREHSGPIDLLLTDVVMPQMDGRSLYRQLSPERPEMKVLYVSGYTEDAIVHHGVLDHDVNFLQKPFTVFGLTSKVRDVLDQPMSSQMISRI
ncbi:MAG: PAS domain S-box protein [Desulfomonilaceae bacterium]